MAQHNLSTVISFEITRTLTKGRFWIATLIVPIIGAIIIALVVLSNTSTNSSVNSQKNEQLTFTYSDSSGLVDPAIATSFGVAEATSPQDAIADVKSGKLDAYFAYPANPVKQPTKVYGADQGIFQNGKYSAVATQVLVSSAETKIDDATLSTLVQGNLPVDATTYKNGQTSGGIGGVIPPLLFLVIFYLVILLLSNQMLSATLEEKENRATEMILTTLNPTTLVIGKVVSLFIIGVVQILVFALPVVIGYLFFRTALNLPSFDLTTLNINPGQMIVGALLLIGGFTLVVSDPNAFIVQVFTYFPYSAPVTTMLRNGFGSLNPLESTIVILELFALGIIVLRIAVRLFRYGSIEYSKKVSLKTVFARQR